MEERVLGVIQAVLGPDSGAASASIGPGSRISDLLDSVSFIKTIVALEREFNFEFDEDDLIISKFPAVKDVIAYVEAKAGRAAQV